MQLYERDAYATGQNANSYLLHAPADAGKVVELVPGYALPHDSDVKAVVVGFDRHINYYKIQYATLCIR